MENNTNQSGTQNRNQSRNRNQNRNRNRGGSGGQNRRNNNSNNNRNKQGGSNNRNRNRNRSRKPKVIVLTPLQKFIKAITFGAIDPNKKPAKPSRQSSNQSKSSPQRKPADSKPNTQAKGRSKTPPKVYEVTSPRLYVGNLDYDAGESELEDLFRGVGNVINAEVVTNSRTQQSKGFAFVEMGSIEEAKRAVEVLHDQEFMSRKLLVSGAKSEGPRDRSESDDSAEPDA